MNGRKLMLGGVVLATAASTGCHFHGHQKRGGSLAPISSAQLDGMPVGEISPPVVETAFVDRHPLLYKPRDVYHTTSHGPIIKTMAATVVGVPAGVVCEVGQIFHGCDRCLR